MPAWYRICDTCGKVIDARGCCYQCETEQQVQVGHVYCYGQDNYNDEERGYYCVFNGIYDDLDEVCKGRWVRHPEKEWLREWKWQCDKAK